MKLDNGKEAVLVLKRGTVLHDNDLLLSTQQTVVKICAADELLSVVKSNDSLLIAKACYHLGNRHMPLQIETGRLCYLHDHVLDDMLRGLGLEVHQITVPFNPEPGAYDSSSTGHHHGH